jgi:hypothetical protein
MGAAGKPGTPGQDGKKGKRGKKGIGLPGPKVGSLFFTTLSLYLFS